RAAPAGLRHRRRLRRRPAVRGQSRPDRTRPFRPPSPGAGALQIPAAGFRPLPGRWQAGFRADALAEPGIGGRLDPRRGRQGGGRPSGALPLYAAAIRRVVRYIQGAGRQRPGSRFQRAYARPVRPLCPRGAGLRFPGFARLGLPRAGHSPCGAGPGAAAAGIPGARLAGLDLRSIIMNKAFVKESDHDEDDDLPESRALPAGTKNYMTTAGYRALNEELMHLMNVERPEVVSVVSWAASNGDRSENGDYLYGKKRLREIDRRIRYLTRRLESAEVVDPAQQPNRDQVFFGATVSYCDSKGEEFTVTIVGVDEAEPLAGKIS